MKINRPNTVIMDNDRLRQELELFISQVEDKGPPCPNCESYVESDCSPKCSKAAQALSNDPENHPLESKVVPISYELASSRVFQTCWSCEGHLDPEGNLWKYPQVSFYVSAPVYSQILLKYINNLNSEGRLSYPWHVLVSDFGPVDGVSYTLQPNLNMQTDIHLGKLQQDLLTVSDNLAYNLKMIARQLLAQL